MVNHWAIDDRNDGDAVVVVFSDYMINDPGPSSFAFRHILRDQPFNVLYIKDPANHWYNRSIQGLGNSIGENVAAIKSLIDERGWKRVTCVGASMGGYGALLYGGLLGAKRVLAFSPQTFIAPGFPRYRPDHHAGEYVDLAFHPALLSIGSILVLASVDELFDVYSLMRLPDVAQMELRFLFPSSHLVPRMLAERSLLQPLLNAYLANGANAVPALPESEIQPRQVSSLVKDAIEASYREGDDRAAKTFRQLLVAYPQWAGCHLGLGKALRCSNNDGQAEEHLRKALDINPLLYEAALELMWMYKRDRLHLEAVAPAVQAAAVNKNLEAQRDEVIGLALDDIERAVAAGDQEATPHFARFLDYTADAERLDKAMQARIEAMRRGFERPRSVMNWIIRKLRAIGRMGRSQPVAKVRQQNRDLPVSSAPPTLEECKTKLTRARNIIGCFEALHDAGAEDVTYLEVGCSFKEDEGLSTYVAAKFIAEKLRGGHVLSLEMNPDHVASSKEIVGKYEPALLERIKWIVGSSVETLPDALAGINKVDFAFLDGGAHPATNLFELLLVWDKLSENGIILVDDCVHLKPTPAYSGRRDFGKAQLILPFLLIVEHINYTRGSVSEKAPNTASSRDVLTMMLQQPSVTPFTTELYNSARMQEICAKLDDLEFAFCGTQLLVARRAVVDRLTGGKQSNRVSF